METKKCSKCGEVKNIESFDTRKRKKRNGEVYIYLIPSCRECNNKYTNNWSKKNKDKLRKYQENQKENHKKRQKKYYFLNKDKLKKPPYLEKDRIRQFEKRRKFTATIDGKLVNINTVPHELKPFIQIAIDIKNLKLELKQKRKKIEKGEI